MDLSPNLKGNVGENASENGTPNPRNTQSCSSHNKIHLKLTEELLTDSEFLIPYIFAIKLNKISFKVKSKD